MLSSDKPMCPMCEGSGYLNERTKNSTSTSLQEIEEESRRNYVTNSNVIGDSSFADKATKNRQRSSSSPDRLSITVDYVATLNQPSPGDSEKLVSTHETLRLIIQKLKQNHWEQNVSALLNVVHISRTRPEIIDPSMPLITRSLISLMKNVRPQVVRTTCQIAEELFRTMQCTQKPEFDELVSTLLQKTSHMSEAVRQDANQALDAMVVYIPALHCVCVMSGSGGAGHKNPIVRITVSRLLYDIVCGVGIETFLNTPSLKDTRKRTFFMCIEFLNDSSAQTRSNARRLMQLLMRHSDFDFAFSQDVDRATIRKIEKQLVVLKYEETRNN